MAERPGGIFTASLRRPGRRSSWSPRYGALAVDPNDEAVIYAGDEMGICKSVGPRRQLGAAPGAYGRADGLVDSSRPE